MKNALIRRGGLMAACLVMFLMTACGSSSSGPVPTATPGEPPTAVPTETPQPTATADPDCRKREVEDWLQASGQHSRGMIMTLNTAVVTPREKIGDVLARINAIRALVDNTKVPGCATESKQAVTALFDIVVTRLTAFRDGQDIDMQALVNDASGLYEVVKLQDAALRKLYLRLPREE
ncbi:MAG: hypothetical protein KF716_21610 [Anaerolineae bacterium]|nr:hypothetical protein [Anaerolineae bacterium]